MTATLSPYRWLTSKRLAPARLWLYATVSVGFLSGLLLIFQAALLAHIIAQVFIYKQALRTLYAAMAGILSLILLRASLAWLKEVLGFHTSALIRTSLRQQILEHLAKLGPVQTSTLGTTGSLVSSALEQVESLHDFFAYYLPQMSIAALLPLVILVFIFPLNWVAASILLITAPLIPLFMAIIGWGAKAASQKNWQALARMSGFFLDRLQGITTLKIFQQTRAQIKLIQTISDEQRKKTMAVLRIAFFSSAVLEFFSALAIALLATYLGLSLLGFIPFGYYSQGASLGTALFILLLAPDFYAPLRELGTHYHARAQALAAAEEIRKILETEPQTQQVPSPQTLPQSERFTLNFEQVYFAYAAGTRPALQAINFSVKPGEKLLIVGPSGAGKTTLINLLLGFISPTQGRLTVNAMDLRQLQAAYWREQIAYVGQNTRLFHGTIRDNILLAKPQASEAELAAALQAAQVLEFLPSLAKGLETEIKEQNLGLSGGQAQRIALARAYLKDAPILLLDEPTASLDSASENLVLKALPALTAHKTVITLTHRQQAMREAERIIVLDQGHIIAEGSYTQLLAHSPEVSSLLQGDDDA